MTRLPTLQPRRVVRALERAGFDVIRSRGSHFQLLDSRTGRRVTVPMHGRDLSKATLASILNQAGLTVEDLLGLL